MKERKIEEQLTLSKDLDLPFYSDLSMFPLVKEARQLIPHAYVKQHKILPVILEQDSVTVAFTSNDFFERLQELRFIFARKINPIITSREALAYGMEKCYQEIEKTLHKSPKEEYLEEEVDYDLSHEQSQSEVVQFLNQILIQAIRKKSSDVHFDPTDQGLNIRLRVDGVLVVINKIPKEFSKQLVTRLKVLSKMDIAETRLPQDGRIKIKYSEKEIDFRVSSVPTVYGERMVLRILDSSQVVVGLEQSGMQSVILKSFRKMMKKTQGLILVTGPTGSGKTSTLYGALSELDAQSLNIMTIEDPVEFKIPTLAQMNVNHKIDFTFAKGLRHILRQDPDVIMVGEIRDLETAQIAIQAALTGHLVISTLHTNDAPSAITRLIDMGVEPFLISSCLTGVLAQRLVRKICQNCYQLDIQSDAKKSILGIDINTPIFCSKGCVECFGLGYVGRIGIFEWMEIGEKIQEQLMTSSDRTQLVKIAKSCGMITLKESGIEKILQKYTSIDEVIQTIP